MKPRVLAVALVHVRHYRPAARRRPLPRLPPRPRPDMADLEAVQRIKDEGLQRSQVMDTAWNLTEVLRPAVDQLPRRPRRRRLGSQAADRLGRLERPAGNVGTVRPRLGEREVHGQRVAPQPFPLIAFPRAWTPGTERNGDGRGRDAPNPHRPGHGGMERQAQGQDRAARQRHAEVRALFTPLGRRFTEQELTGPAERSRSTPARGRGGAGRWAAGRSQLQPARHAVPGQGRRGGDARAGLGPQRPRRDPGDQRAGHLPRRRRHRPSRRRSWWPRSTTTASRAWSTRRSRCRLELNVQNRFHGETLERVQPRRRDPRHRPRRRSGDAGRPLRLVARGHGRHRQRRRLGRDDGGDAHPEGHRRCGCAAPCAWRCGPARSRACSARAPTCKQQFGDRDTMALLPGHAKLSAYFNMDNGTGAFRGVYLQGNEAVRPVFAAWMEPFAQPGHDHAVDPQHRRPPITSRSTRWACPASSSSRTRWSTATHSHHTNMDVYDRLQAEDLMKNAVIVASFVVPRGQSRRAAASQGAAAAARAAARRVDAVAHGTVILARRLAAAVLAAAATYVVTRSQAATRAGRGAHARGPPSWPRPGRTTSGCSRRSSASVSRSAPPRTCSTRPSASCARRSRRWRPRRSTPTAARSWIWPRPPSTGFKTRDHRADGRAPQGHRHAGQAASPTR